MSLTADEVYDLIKLFEAQFPVPAPYVTIDVGTFDAMSGTFSGLTTRVDFDPEPIEHGPHDHPKNPPPRYQAEEWVSVSIDASWRRTTTFVPAPKVPLAPVLLQFAIANTASGWSATVNGLTVAAPPGQNGLTVSIWDATITNWSVQAGAISYKDTLRIQRPVGDLGTGVGAFTIPALPVTIVYAPSADSLGLSVATYSVGQTVGTTITYEMGTDSSQTVPNLDTSFATNADFVAGLQGIGEVLKLSGEEAAGQVFSQVSTQIGQFSSTQQTGISDLSQTQMTVSQTTSDAFSTSAKIGGPGVGDLVHFYKDVRLVWFYFKEQLRLYPLDYHEAVFTVTFLQHHSVGIPAEDVQLLLGLDPFVSGGAQATLPSDRFTFQETWEFGGGANFDQKVTVTRETKDETTHKTYTTDTDEWEPGLIFKLLGLGEKNQTTVTLSNARGDDVSSTITLDANLASGPEDYFIINIWYDNVFGTLAFQQSQPAHLARFQGGGLQPAQQVSLDVGGKVFRTIADQSGNFVFKAPTIPDGDATLTIAGQPGRPVTI
jgi:hypothetical protein